MKKLIAFFRPRKNISVPTIFLWLCVKTEESIRNAVTLETMDIIKHTWLRRINEEFGKDRDLAWLIGDLWDKYDDKVKQIVGDYYLNKINFQQA